MKRVLILEFIVLRYFFHDFSHFIKPDVSILVFFHFGPNMFTTESLKITGNPIDGLGYMLILILLENRLILIHNINLLILPLPLHSMFVGVFHIVEKGQIVEVTHQGGHTVVAAVQN